MTHSTRFVLVDGKRRIRGYYITGEDGFHAEAACTISASCKRERS